MPAKKRKKSKFSIAVEKTSIVAVTTKNFEGGKPINPISETTDTAFSTTNLVVEKQILAADRSNDAEA